MAAWGRDFRAPERFGEALDEAVTNLRARPTEPFAGHLAIAFGLQEGAESGDVSGA